MSATEAVSLQERLQLIQQQQTKRFKSRKALSVKNVCADCQGETTSFRAHHKHFGKAFDADTDLDLRTVSQEDKSNKVKMSASTSNDANQDGPRDTVKEIEHLKCQVEQLQLDNTRLKLELKQREKKVTELENARKEESIALGAGSNSSATQRIVELSKKNRELNAELAREKNHLRELQKKLKECEKSAVQRETSLDSSNKRSECKHPPTPQEESGSVIAQLQNQLQQTKLKMAEQRNQCQVLKQELKLAQKVITKEVGEGVNMSVLLSGVSKWRGRAQQIISLQNKVADLNEQLQQSRQSSSTQVGNMTFSCDTPVGLMTDARQKATLHKIEIDKQKNLDEVRSELETLRSDYSTIKQQCSALKARNKTLTSDIKSLRAQITSLTKKQSQNNKVMGTSRDSYNSSNSDGHVSQDEGHSLQDIEKENRLLFKANQALQTQLDKCLIELQAVRRINRMETNTNHIEQASPTAPLSLPPVIPNGGQRNQRFRVQVQERKAISAGQPLGSLHSRCYRDSTISIKVSQIEQERLLELTKCLQQRLDGATDKLMRLEVEMRTLRQQNARLEKIVGRRHTTTVGSGYKGNNEHETVEELETQLAIQMDENVVLKNTLELTRQEKMEDIKIFQKMLQETKKLYLS